MNSLGGYIGPNRGPSGESLRSGNMQKKEKIPSGYKQYSLNNYTPEQDQLFNQGLDDVGPDSYLYKLAHGDQSAYDEMEAPAMRQFQQFQGQNSARFNSFGHGATKGTDFQNFQNQATSDFAQDLASKRSELRRQAIQDLRGMTQDLLGNRPYEKGLVQKEDQGMLGGYGGVLGAGAGAVGGFFAGGPAGVLPGATLGHQVGSKF
jgi:hypothetical protein